MPKAGRGLLAAPLGSVQGAGAPSEGTSTILLWNNPSLLVLDHPWISVTSSFPQPLLRFIACPIWSCLYYLLGIMAWS